MTRKRRTSSPLVVLAAVAAVALIVVGSIGLWQSLSVRDTASTVDMRGQAVALDPGEAPISAQSSRAVDDTGSRLLVPSVDLDVPLGALDAVDGQITPPGFTSAYRVRNMGVDPAQSDSGTVFVVMHSLRGGAVGPGNYLIDVDRQRSTVPDGATVIVDGVTFTVTGSSLVSKNRIASESTVWANTPNRLLVITCLQNADGSPSTDNLIITAQRS